MRGHHLAPFVLCVVIALTGCTVWKERPAATFSQATGGEELERLFWKEIKARNWTEVERHMASNFVSITSEGQHDRAAALARLKQLELEDYSLGDFQTQLNGDTFVIAYSITMRGKRNGEPLPEGPHRVLAVWQDQKEGWVEIAHTMIGPQAK